MDDSTSLAFKMCTSNTLGLSLSQKLMPNLSVVTAAEVRICTRPHSLHRAPTRVVPSWFEACTQCIIRILLTIVFSVPQIPMGGSVKIGAAFTIA